MKQYADLAHPSTRIKLRTPLLKQAQRLILQESSFQFNGKNYLQTHGTAMGSKMSVAFANIFMAKVETDILSRRDTKPQVWKRFLDDIFYSREEIAISSLRKLINTTPQLDLRRKYLKRNDVLGYYYGSPGGPDSDFVYIFHFSVFIFYVSVFVFYFSVFVFNVLIFTSPFCFLVLVLILIF